MDPLATQENYLAQIAHLKQIIQRHELEEQKLHEVYLNRKQALENIHNDVPRLNDFDSFTIRDNSETPDYTSVKSNHPLNKKFDGSYCIETQRYLDAIQLQSSQNSVTILMTLHSSPEGDKQYSDTSDKEQEGVSTTTQDTQLRQTHTAMSLSHMDAKEPHESPPIQPHVLEPVIVPEETGESLLLTEVEMLTDDLIDTLQSVSERRRAFLRSIRLDYFQTHHLSETAPMIYISEDEWVDINQMINETLPTLFHPVLDEGPISSSEQDKYETALSQARQDHADDLRHISERNTRQRMLHQWGLYLSTKYETDLIQTKLRWPKYRFYYNDQTIHAPDYTLDRSSALYLTQYTSYYALEESKRRYRRKLVYSNKIKNLN